MRFCKLATILFLLLNPMASFAQTLDNNEFNWQARVSPLPGPTAIEITPKGLLLGEYDTTLRVDKYNGLAILKDPAPVVKVHELADSSVNFVVRPWVATENYWDVYWDITRSVKERFDAEGVSIPFPQRDIHVYQETAA